MFDCKCVDIAALFYGTWCMRRWRHTSSRLIVSRPRPSSLPTVRVLFTLLRCRSSSTARTRSITNCDCGHYCRATGCDAVDTRTQTQRAGSVRVALEDARISSI